MQKLVINYNGTFPISTEEQLAIIKNAGFDGVFGTFYPEDIGPFAKDVKDAGLYFQSVHAPFENVHTVWENESSGDDEINMLKNVIRKSSESGVHLVVIHAIIGMKRHTPTPLGVERFLSLFDFAKEQNVKIALENTEGEEYLEALLDASKAYENVGFCIDTGHEMCYNHSRDLIGKYADRLFSTHLNDNLGQTGEAITFYDDSHLMPFDGVADWDNIAARLIAAGFNGDLTFELNKASRPHRTANDIYKDLSPKEFIGLAYQKAAKFRDIFNTLLMKRMSTSVPRHR